MMNCASFVSEFCSLDDAGFAFTAQHVPLHKSSYRLRRSANFQHFKHQRKTKVISKPTAAAISAPSAPTYNNILLAYLSQFNPAVVSRVVQDHFVYGYHEAIVSVDLSKNPNGRHPLINALWLLNLRMEHIPLIIDTGASCCITPCKSDFKPGSYRSSDIKVRDLSGENQVIGQGAVLWTVKDTRGRKQVIELPALHIPTAKVRLLSPQVLKKLHNVGGSIEEDGIALFGSDDVRIFAPYNDLSNLPELTLHDPPSAGAFWESAFAMDDELRKAASDPHARSFESAFLNTLDDGNGNLKSSQKELLLWHHKLSHTNFAKVRLLTKNTQWIRVSDIADDALHVDAILPMAHSTPSAQETLDCKCAACLMAKARRKTPAKPSTIISTPAEMVLKTDDLVPGQCISVDHYVSPTRGRRVDGYGRAAHRDGYVGGAVFVDHASSKVFHQPQTDLSASSTIFGKQRVEDEAKSCGISVKKYHSDNGVFCSHEFREHCKGQNQDLDFSAPGAKHQNGVAERAIGTLSRMARANLIHLMIHWPQFCDINLWALAMNYAVWVYNRLPKRSLGGLSPNEFWSGSRSDHSDLRRTHVFGCPIYVLDPDLQDGKRIPKWTSRARKGMFVGFSSEHSSQCPLVLNLETGHISPQYHVVFDDKFASVVSLDKSHADVESVFESLHNAGMSELFLDPEEIYGFKAPDGVSDGGSNGAPANGPDGASDGVCFDESRPQRSEQARRAPQRLDPNPSKRAYTLLPIGAAVLPLTSWAQPPAIFANTMKQPRLFHNKVKVSRADLAERSLLRGSWSNEVSAFTAGHCGSQLSLPWVDDDTYWNNASESEKYSYNATTARVNALILPDLSPMASPSDGLIDTIEPHALSAKTRSNAEDNPTWTEAMSGDNAADYYNAAIEELITLQEKLHCWELVRYEKTMNVLPSTWAFKCKRYPDGRIKKFKARFCARGDRQKEGIDYFETWSPVVQWQTVRLMMIFSSILGLKSAQADITAAFVHADLPEEVYIQQPKGFEYSNPNDPDARFVLKLNKALYGLKQAPRHFFNHLKARLEKHGVRQSTCDPCLFIGNHIIVVVYVDDLLLYAREDSTIDKLIKDLHDDGVWIRKEGSAEGFLGVDIKQNQDGSFTLTQTGLITRVLDALGLHASFTSEKDTPAETTPLPKDTDGDPPDSSINYPSVVGMLLYLAGHTRPDISFAVHQCARYTFKPTKRHCLALKRIGRYLKGTQGKGLIMTPSDYIHVDCYPDADFAGLYNTKDAQDPHCVRSRTGFVILVAGCPVLWKSKLQSEIALSTMEAEYVALSTSCKDLFPLLDLIRELSSAVNLPMDKHSNMHIKIHEDNVGALTLGKLEPRRMTPRSKHYAIKYHWFREQIGPRNIELIKVDTTNQLGDIFTKGLGATAFQRLRLKLMGW
jgi:hypothetical protein